MSWDPYLDLDTGVLHNRLGITDGDELTRAEANFTSVRIAQLRRHPLPGRYDLAHLQAFHRRIFDDVYDWAGELRTVSIGKGDLFCLPQHLTSFGDEVFGRLARAAHRGDNTPLHTMLDQLVDHPEEPADAGRARTPVPRRAGDGFPPGPSRS